MEGGCSCECILNTWYFCTGVVTWARLQPPNLRSTLPVLSVSDLDGDGVSDVALVAPSPTQVNLRGVLDVSV